MSEIARLCRNIHSRWLAGIVLRAFAVLERPTERDAWPSLTRDDTQVEVDVLRPSDKLNNDVRVCEGIHVAYERFGARADWQLARRAASIALLQESEHKEGVFVKTQWLSTFTIKFSND